jgi:Uma2 family endonuclease
MNVLEYLPKYTVKDYNLWEGDWELIEGHAVSMSPSPMRKHQRLSIVLVSHIEIEINSNKITCGDCEVVFDLDWIVNDNTVLRPDIAIICDQSSDFITKPPVLVIEILSPSTALRDKNMKFEIYRQNGVKYYIIVDPATKTHQSYTLVNGLYQECPNSMFSIHNDCDISLDVAAIMTELKD